MAKNSGIAAAAFKKTTGGSITEYQLNAATGTITIAGFTASDSAEALLLITNNSALDGQAANFSTDGLVTIAGVLLGDVNNDGIVTIADAILACQVMSRMSTTGQTVASDADVNGDGKIGMAEVIYILQGVTSAPSGHERGKTSHQIS